MYIYYVWTDGGIFPDEYVNLDDAWQRLCELNEEGYDCRIVDRDNQTLYEFISGSLTKGI